ncbi:MAG TPA: outer membrane beta-barrel domain-containing protein [Myxococcaceae bacterium]|nr:outer membrane beta-barrel domain-containing protein [Myxococcaceae bacterium]
MRALIATLCLALLPVAAYAETEDDAGDVSEVDKDRVGPLRERVRPVSGHVFLKHGRVEVSPSVTSSFNDPFFWKFLAGATVAYYPMEWLGVNLRLGLDAPSMFAGQPVISPAAEICTTEATGQGTTRGCRTPTYAELNGRAPGQISFIGGADVQYAPVYGKVGLIAEKFINFDLYGLGGLSLVGYKGPGGTIGVSTPMVTGGLNLGLGAHFVVSRWFAVRTELRDLLYVEDVEGTDTKSFRSQLLFELGFSLFFPTTFTGE